MQIKIQEVIKEDIDKLMSIEELVYPNHHWSKDSYYNELSNKLAHYYCAKNQDNELLGYIGYWEIFEEAHITTLAVHPNFRNQKIAHTLICQMLKDCYKKMIKYLTLEVRFSNICAISLYEKFGFKSIGRRKNYYQDNNEDALIMFTENIWYDTFKTNYTNICKEMNKVAVSYVE